MIIQKNISLKPFNTFGINVSAKYFSELIYIEEVEELLSSEIAKTEKKMILGGGSNVLFTKNCAVPSPFLAPTYIGLVLPNDAVLVPVPVPKLEPF